jgi:hypothetical protein
MRGHLHAITSSTQQSSAATDTSTRTGTASGSGLISRPALVALRRAADAFRAGVAGVALEERIQRVADLAAADAHVRGATAAQLIVAIKAECGALGEIRRLAYGSAAQVLCEAIVTRSIRAYYAASPSRPR